MGIQGRRRLFSIDSFRPPGPVAAAFIAAAETVPFIMGPVGSGKTNATIFKLLRHTALMPPGRDGVVRAKMAIVRTDYRTLYKTTLSSWHRWFPQDFPGSDWTGGADRPAVHVVRFKTPRGRRIELIAEFQALGDKRIEDVLRGWEGSAAWLNEADLLDESALTFLLQRVPRWPAKRDLEHGASLKALVVGDLNPPGDPDHWIVKRFLDAPPEGHRLYQQPSGLSPAAENVPNLPDAYYERLAATMPPWDVQRFVHGKVGYDRSGLPVYPEFDPAHNLAPQKLAPIAGLPIIIGLDGALHPAGVIVQRAPNLQKRVLRELYFGRMGPTRFGEQLCAALVDAFPHNPIGGLFYDPSADYGADKEGGEQSWIEIVALALRKLLGPEVSVPVLPAPTNEPTLRIEAVRNSLVQVIDAQTRGMIVDPGCTMLVKGFMSHYRFKLNPDGRVQNPIAPRPEKNEYANPHDALQYACLGLDGRAGAIATAARGARQPSAVGAARGSQNFVASSDFRL